MKKIYLNILFVILATFSLTVHAEQGTEKPLDAIVEIRITVPENARTAERFGTNRVASGVVIDRFSGAALIDRNGHLVGIGYLFSQLRIADLGLMPTNMFVPIDLLKPILSDLKLSGRSKLPSRPWLGVRTEEFYGRLVVERVVSDSPSEKAGIKAGDIILAVSKQEVHGMADFYRKVWALGNAGVDVPLRILQGIQIRDIVVHSTAGNQYRQPVPSSVEM